MPLIDVQYAPGTQKSPQQTELSQASFQSTDKVHFPDGLLRSIPEWEADTPAEIDLLGGARSVFSSQLTGAQVGAYYFIGTNKRLYVILNNVIYNITPLVTTATATLGSNPIATTNTSTTVTVTYTGHGLAIGDRIKLAGATATGGVPAGDLNIEHIVTGAPTANTFTITVNTSATSTTTGGGASVDIFKQITDGNLNQGIASGWGAGLWGAGLWGRGTTTPSLLSYPRIWSFESFGNQVVMCPGDYNAGDGQKVYVWDGDTAVAPTVLTNAPTDVNWVSVINNSVVALAGDTVKISSIAAATTWSIGGDSTAYTAQIQRIPRLISLAPFGPKSAILFSEDEVLRLTYIGDPDYWDIETVSVEDGLIAPQAWAILNDVVYWMGKRGWYRYAGSYVEKLNNTQNEDFWFDNLNSSQIWKSFAYADVNDEEVYFHAPSGSDNEPCDYNIYNIKNRSWTLGRLDRTAAQRPSFVGGKFYIVNSSSESVAGTVYRHFVDNPNLDIGWSAKTAEAYGDPERRLVVREFMPDSNQGGDMTMKVYTREFAQSATENVSSSYTISSTTTNVYTRAGGRVRSLEFSGNKSFTLGAWKERVEYA